VAPRVMCFNTAGSRTCGGCPDGESSYSNTGETGDTGVGSGERYDEKCTTSLTRVHNDTMTRRISNNCVQSVTRLKRNASKREDVLITNIRSVRVNVLYWLWLVSVQFAELFRLWYKIVCLVWFVAANL